MSRSSVHALAKINLALHVGPPRADGYHPVDTLCVFVEAGDVLSLGEGASDFSLSINGPASQGLASTSDNLILRAAHSYAAANPAAPVAFHLEKHVPVASGIGGGTSNGVAALVLLNERAEVPLLDSAMMKLAEGLGADGPVCLAPLLKGTDSFRAQGIGFEVTEGPNLPPLHVVLANPGVEVPTGAVFAAFDQGYAPEPLDLPGVTRLSDGSSVQAFIDRTRNDLAPAARDFCPAIKDLEAQLVAAPGCLAARMSGSGATVFGLFASASSSERASRRLRGQGVWSISAPLHRGGGA